MQWGFQVSSLRKVLTTKDEVAAAFAKLSKMGFKYVQNQWINPSVPDEFVRDAMQENGIECVATQDMIGEIEKDFERYMRQLQLWNCRYFTVSGIPEQFLSCEGLKTYSARLLEIEERCKELNCIMTFHPRRQEYVDIAGAPATMRLMDLLPQSVQMTLDLYHVVKSGLSVPDTITAFAGRMDMVHFKNFRKLPNGAEELCTTGEGIIDYRSIAKLCSNASVRYAFIEQERWNGDPFAVMQKSLDFARSINI